MRSTRTSVWALASTSRAPPAPSFTTASPATTWPARKFEFEAVGTAPRPAGYTVR